MVECTVCGNSNPPDSQYCQYCGVKLGFLSLFVKKGSDVSKELEAEDLRNGGAVLDFQASSTDPTHFDLVLRNSGAAPVDVEVLSLDQQGSEYSVTFQAGNTFTEKRALRVPTEQFFPLKMRVTNPIAPKRPAQALDFKVKVFTDGIQTRERGYVIADGEPAYDKRFMVPDEGCKSTAFVNLRIDFLAKPKLEVDEGVLFITDDVMERPINIVNSGDSDLLDVSIEFPGSCELYDTDQIVGPGERRRPMPTQAVDDERFKVSVGCLRGNSRKKMALRVTDHGGLKAEEAVSIRARVGDQLEEHYIGFLRRFASGGERRPAFIFGFDFGTSSTSIGFLQTMPDGKHKEGFVLDDEGRSRWPSLLVWKREKTENPELGAGDFRTGPRVKQIADDENMDRSYWTIPIRGLKTLIRGDDHEYTKGKYHRTEVFVVREDGVPENEWKVWLEGDLIVERDRRMEEQGLDRNDADQRDRIVKEIQREMQDKLVRRTIEFGPARGTPEWTRYISQFRNDNLLQRYLSYLHQLTRKHIDENGGGDDYMAVFTVPILERDLANGAIGDTTQFQNSTDIKAMLEAAKRAGFRVDPDHCKILFEPVSAALYFLTRWSEMFREIPLKDNDLILVFDAGAGTTDVALLKVSISDGRTHLTPLGYKGGLMPQGSKKENIKYVAGVYVDDLVKDAVAKANMDAFRIWDIVNAQGKLNPLFDSFRYEKGDRSMSPISQFQFIHKAEELKIKLNELDGKGNRSERKSVEVRLEEMMLTLNRAEFEEAVKGTLEDLVQSALSVIREAGQDISEINHVFLVGGTSNIFLLQDIFVRSFSTRVRQIKDGARSKTNEIRKRAGNIRMHSVAGGAVRVHDVKIDTTGITLELSNDTGDERHMLLGANARSVDLVNQNAVSRKGRVGFFGYTRNRLYPLKVEVNEGGIRQVIGRFVIDVPDYAPKKGSVLIDWEIKDDDVVELADGQGGLARMFHLYYQVGDGDRQLAFSYSLSFSRQRQ